MRFEVKDIPPQGQPFSAKMPPKWLAEHFGDDDELRAYLDTPVEIKGEFAYLGGYLVIRGELTTELHPTCDRCLESFTLRIDERYCYRLVPYGPAAGESADDVLSYRDGIVDLLDVAGEVVALAMPSAILCKEECLGICQFCGSNRNQVHCSCANEAKHHTFAELAYRYGEAKRGGKPN